MSDVSEIVTVESLINKAKNAFAKAFPNFSPSVVACAPGRVNLIGEHTDYNEGFVFPMVSRLDFMFFYCISAMLASTTQQKCEGGWWAV